MKMKKYNIVLGLFVSVFILAGSVFAFMPQHARAEWTPQPSSGLHYWKSITSSSDGVNMTAIDSVNGPGGSGGGLVYTSANSGINWTQQPGSGLHYWKSITSSSDGVNMAAIENINTSSGNYGYIYISSDSGFSWRIALGIPGNF